MELEEALKSGLARLWIRLILPTNTLPWLPYLLKHDIPSPTLRILMPGLAIPSLSTAVFHSINIQ
jgi:hypothetical protein